MELLAFGLPLGIVLLVAVGTYRARRRRRSGSTVTATYLNEVTAVFYGTKRDQLDHRDATSITRQVDAQGAPPTGLDLDKSVMLLRPDGPDLAR